MHQKQLCTNNYNLKNCHCFVNKERISKKFVKHSIMTISGTSSIYEFSFCFISFSLTTAFSTVNNHVLYGRGSTSEQNCGFRSFEFDFGQKWLIRVRDWPVVVDLNTKSVKNVFFIEFWLKMANFSSISVEKGQFELICVKSWQIFDLILVKNGQNLFHFGKDYQF